MANGDLGSIYYTVNANTSSLLKAEAIINKSLSKNVEAFDKAEKAVVEFEAAQKKLGRTINDWGQVLNKNNKVVVSASEQYRELANKAESLRDPLLKQTKVSQGVSEGFKKMQRAGQNFGYQMQDIAVQFAGGQNPILILSQQLPQLAVGMGAAASIAGALLAVLGSLALVFMKNTDNAKKLDEAIERIQASITLGAGGIANYSEEMKRLKDVSEALTRIKLANLIADQQEATKLAAKAINEQVSGLRGSFDTFNDVIKDTFGGITKEGISAYQALAAASKRFNTNQSAESVMELERALEQATAAGINNTKQGRELASSLVDLIFQYKNGKITIDALKESLESASLVVGEQKGKVEELITALNLQAATIAMTDRELALYTATQNGATQADIAAINAAFDKIDAYKAEEESQKARTQALKDYHAETMRQLEAEERLRQQGTSFAQGAIKKGMSEPERLAADLVKLQELHDQELITTELFEAAKTSIIQQEAEARKKIADDEMKAKVAQQNAILSSSSQFFGAAADLIGQAAGEQSAAYKIMYGISKGFAIAQAILNLQTAISNASALPWPVNIPAMASAAASGAALVSNIQGLAYGGGRLYGGKVNPGTMYPVNENGAPEMFTDGTKQYLMPNARGEVISNKDATSAGGGLNVYNNIVNNSSAQVTSSSRVEGDGANRKLIIDTVVSDIRSGGATRRAITDATTAKNRTL